MQAVNNTNHILGHVDAHGVMHGFVASHTAALVPGARTLLVLPVSWGLRLLCGYMRRIGPLKRSSSSADQPM